MGTLVRKIQRQRAAIISVRITVCYCAVTLADRDADRSAVPTSCSLT